MNDVEKFLMERRPIFCKKCGGKLFYQSGGVYQCEDCGSEELDDFGVIKVYLEENGPSPATDIADGTGVPLEIVNLFLRYGRLEILEGSKYFIKCERCGCALRYGRFCYDCTKELTHKLLGTVFEVVGEKPKVLKGKKIARMRFLDGKNKKEK